MNQNSTFNPFKGRHASLLNPFNPFFLKYSNPQSSIMSFINSSLASFQNPPNNRPSPSERVNHQCRRNIIPHEGPRGPNSPRNQEKSNPNKVINGLLGKGEKEDIKKKEDDPNSGFYYNKRGDDCFKKGQYKEAIEEYTKAIGMNDTESAFYCNRARCHRQLGDLQKAYEDVNISIELDDQNVEAQYLGGRVLAEMGKTEVGCHMLEKGLNRINKALALCVRRDQEALRNEIKKARYRVKKVIWLKQEKVAKEKQEKIKGSLMSLLNSETTGVIAGLEPIEHTKARNLIGEYEKRNNRPEIPDELCCKITMEIMEEPVIAQSGVTYEKSALLDHIKRNGKTDPITRKPIDDEFIFENLALKKEIEEFIEKNPWAFEYQYNESDLDVTL